MHFELVLVGEQLSYVVVVGAVALLVAVVLVVVDVGGGGSRHVHTRPFIFCSRTICTRNLTCEPHSVGATTLNSMTQVHLEFKDVVYYCLHVRVLVEVLLQRFAGCLSNHQDIYRCVCCSSTN